MNKDKEHINRFLEGKYSEKDIRSVLDDISEGKNIESYDEYLKKQWLLAVTDENTPQENRQYLEESVLLLNKLTRKQRVIKWTRSLVGLAASVAILLGAGIYINKHLSLEKKIIIAQINHSTGIGQTKTINLPDGTITTLNACAQISYPEKFAGDQRLISLEGEAYFKVVKDEKQPFVIRTKQFDIRVLGTEFNVKAYEGDEVLSISVESGKVQVDMPEAMTRLSANEKLLINTRENKFTKEIDSTEIAVWRSGHLLFNKTPIREVAREMKRIYKCNIIFKEEQIFDNLITGEHTNKSLESVLESIEYTSGIRYKLDKQKLEIVFYKQ